MQNSITYYIRKKVHESLQIYGKQTLFQLARRLGWSKDKIRYAIESTSPFGALFRKHKKNGICYYEGVSIDEPYGGKDYY